MEYTGQCIEKGYITKENVQFYHNRGYLIAHQLLSSEEIKLLKDDATKIFKGQYGVIEGMQDVGEEASDEDVLKRYVAIHFPHKISPVIKAFLSQKNIVKVLESIVSPNVKCMQSMLFIKGPGKAGQAWHQDEYFIPTRDKSLVGAWIAIDDATIDNGCLWIIPGSHKVGYIMPRIENNNNEYADVDTVDISNYSHDKIIPVEVKSGSVVFFNGYLLHSSLRNKSKDHFRTALVNHYMSAESMLPWDQDGSLPKTDDLRDIVMVAGDDPYASKPTVNLTKPYLRPEVIGVKK